MIEEKPLPWQEMLEIFFRRWRTIAGTDCWLSCSRQSLSCRGC